MRIFADFCSFYEISEMKRTRMVSLLAGKESNMSVEVHRSWQHDRLSKPENILYLIE